MTSRNEYFRACKPPVTACGLLSVTWRAGRTINVVVVLQLLPRVVEGLTGFQIAAMAGGREHTLALTRCGKILSFGGGSKDGCTIDTPPVLGVSSTSGTSRTRADRGFASPMQVCGDALGSARVEAIASGWDHCMAITAEGALFAWGIGRHGQLGHGDTGENPPELSALPKGHKVAPKHEARDWVRIRLQSIQ